MLLREEIHSAIDKHFDLNKWGEKIPIDNGGISIEIKIENGLASMEVCDRRRVFVMKK